MALGAEQARGGQETKVGGSKDITRRKFLEAGMGPPLFLFGSMLAGIFKKEQISKFFEEATGTLDFFSAPVSGKGGGGGKSGGGEASKAPAKH